MTTPTLRRSMLALSAIALMSGPAFAYDYNDRAQGDIVYLTGGIGDNELDELEATKSQYNLHITNTAPGGAYVSDTAVVIYDRTNAEVLNTNAGPLLYVNLPAGRYTISAEYQGVVQTKKVTIGRTKASDIHLTWNVAE